MSWVKLKASVMDAMCRRQLGGGEFSYVSKFSKRECRGKVEMLDMLKQEGSAWAVIAACKGAKEEIKAFEKKVKTQFSLVPFEDITPVPQEFEKDKKVSDEEKANAKSKSDGEEKEETEREGKELREKQEKEQGLEATAEEEDEVGPPSKVRKIEDVKTPVTKEGSEKKEMHPASILLTRRGHEHLDFKIEQTGSYKNLPNKKTYKSNLISFTAEVTIQGTSYSGKGHSKKAAKKAAVQAAVEALYPEFVLEKDAVPATFNTNLWKPS